MIARLRNFIASANKGILFRYYFSERKSEFNKWINRRFRNIATKGGNKTGKINLSGETSRLFGLHRSGWNYAVIQLKDLHDPRGILMDSFIDQTFSAGRNRFKGYSEPWIGFIHVPPGVPGWMQSSRSNPAIFNNDPWKSSEPYCRGLFTLSENHRDALQSRFGFPVESLMHPTEFPKLTWSPERFAANPDKMIIQTGWWLRRVYSIYLLEVTKYRKAVLLKQDADVDWHMKAELANMESGHRITGRELDSVTRLKFMSNKRYDRLLAGNVVFLDLYDASANNAIIECIARNTPVLVNPLPAVVEYLGPGYPFYFTSLEEAAIKAENTELVLEAHRYLANHPWKEKLTGRYFRKSFMDSAIYQSL